VKVWVYTGEQIGSGEEAEAQRAMDRAKALAEGRPVDDRPGRRKSARKAASVAKKVTGVGSRPQQQPKTAPAEQVPADTSDTAGSPAQPGGPGHTVPASVTEPGETPKTDVEQATTESLPPQSGPMTVESVTDADVTPTDEAAPADAVPAGSTEGATAEADTDKPSTSVTDVEQAADVPSPTEADEAGKEGES